MNRKRKISVSELRMVSHAMVANGTMPALDDVLKIIFEVREKYQLKILEARREARSK